MLEKGIKRNVLNIEIFEWEKYSKDDVVEAIEKKLKNKKYPEYYNLLCLINQDVQKLIDLRDIHLRLRNKNIKLDTIWLISRVADSKYDTMIVRVYPDFMRKDFELESLIIKNKDQKPMLKVLKRGTGKEFVPLGNAILPYRPY